MVGIPRVVYTRVYLRREAPEACTTTILWEKGGNPEVQRGLLSLRKRGNPEVQRGLLSLEKRGES